MAQIKFPALVLTLLIFLTTGIFYAPRTAFAQTSPCTSTVSGSHAGQSGTTHAMAFDRNPATYFNSTYDNWQHVQIDMGCVGIFSSLRRHMTTNGTVTNGRRIGQGESISYSRDGVTWTELTRATTNGWQAYVNYGTRQQAWHSVPYGWSAWLNLNTPVQARYIRFLWDDNLDALNEIEINFQVDSHLLAWAQDYPSGQRRVLLRWFGADPAAIYTIYRRPQGATQWQSIGTASFAPNAQAMANTLGANLLAQLSIDLDDQPGDPPLTADGVYQALNTNRLAAVKLAEQHYEVALATGAGYLDMTAPANQAMEYYVAGPSSTAPLYGPLTIAANPPPFPPPANVRESSLFQSVGDLGVLGSTRPFNADERYNWDRYQVLQSADGKALIHWEASNPNTAPTHYVAGYRVYRRSPATGNAWQLANRHAPHQVRPELVSANQPAQTDGPFTADTGFVDDATFEDNVKATFPGHAAAEIYTGWSYRVCSVDLLGNEHSCSPDATIRVRELGSPIAPNQIEATVHPEHTILTVTLQYSDSHEISPPLRAFVLRSPDSTQPISQWHELPSVVINTAMPTVTVQVNDTPSQGSPFWYRVQIRDNAGNWSPAGVMVSAGLYPRTPPPFPPIQQDTNCANNTMPLTLNGLDSVIRQLIVYRSLVPGEPGDLIKRVIVANHTAVISEEYVPPYTLIAYYRLEAVDGHGNHSATQSYCARLDPNGTPSNPTVTVTSTEVEGNSVSYTLEVNTHGDPATPEGTTVTVTRPGESGPISTTVPVNNGQVVITLEEGETAWVNVQGSNFSGVGEGSWVLLRHVNNFLDSNRQMTQITSPWGAEWASGLPSANVRLHFQNRFPDSPVAPEPWVAIFRQAKDGNWLQVTAVQPLASQIGIFDLGSGPQRTWMIEDNADLDTFEDYRYTALAFSPVSFEVLGYWEPITLKAQSAPGVIRLTSLLGLPPQFPNCAFTEAPPKGFDRIRLHNGWIVKVVSVRQANNCQDPAYNPNGLYGVGTLTDGNGASWPINLVNLAITPSGEPGVMEHMGGRIMLDSPGLNLDLNQPGSFPMHFGRVEFLPGHVNAEIVLTLPANVKVVDPQRVERGNQVMALFPNVTPRLEFDPVEVTTSGQCDRGDPGFHLLDEHLPWRLHNDKGLRVSAGGIELLGTTCTSDRLSYTPPAFTNPVTPDNNLAFLRVPFLSNDAVVTPEGLAGNFSTETPVSYVTSLPAAVVIQANSAKLAIDRSQIAGGRLDDAQAALEYFRAGTDLAFMRPDGMLGIGYFRDAHGNGVIPGSERCQWFSLLRDGALDIGPNGLLLGAARMTNSQITRCIHPMNWAGFGVFDGQNTFVDGLLYTAGVSVPAASITGAPSPAEHAWLQRPEPNGNGDLDPGINLNLRGADADFSCYPHLRFHDLDLDLYVRRGGVSENLIINPSAVEVLSQRDPTRYDETLQGYNVVFVDNLIVPDPAPQVTFDVFLPYPSDVTVPLQGSNFSVEGCPIGGDVRGTPPELLHKYWNFRQTPKSWLYTVAKQDYYARQLASNGGGTLPAETLRLYGVGLINGLGATVTSLAQTDDFAAVSIESEWFPNGDYGDITVADGATTNTFRISGIPYKLNDVKLSHYYERLMDTNSLPDTLGLELDVSLTGLPSELLNGAGNLTQQSLKACSTGNTVGCGFVVVDGAGAVDYFGQIERLPANSVQAAGVTSIIGDFLGDEPQGLWPVATNNRTARQAQALLERPSIHWVWPVVNKLVDLPIPVKFLANSSGGALAGVLQDAPFFPGEIAGIPLEVLRMDIAAVATVHFDEGISSFQSEFGVFTGYGASQAAFRALAMNRPREDGQPGLRPFDNWSDVSVDIVKWTRDFGYPINPGGADDPVDLAQEIWAQWNNPAHDNERRPDRARRAKSFDKTYNILYAHFEERLLASPDRRLPTYGITPLESGELLNCLGVGINHGMGQAIFFVDGQGFEIESLQLGVRLDVDTEGHCNNPADNDGGLLHADWLSMDYNRDDEFIIKGENIDINVIEFLQIDDVDLHFLIGTQDGFERVEGSIHAPAVIVPGVDTILTARLQPVAFVFGSGMFNGEELHYIGGKGAAYVAGAGLGGALLLGRIDPGSQVLLNSDFGALMQKFGADAQAHSPHGRTIYDGYYVMIMGAVPIFSTDICILKFGLAGEVRVWHWEPISGGNTVWGGRVSLAGFGTLLCLLHQRIQLGLTLEQVNNGWPSATEPLCTNAAGCYVATGDVWMVDGIGFCSPETWDNWDTRWWDDGWCWTFGAQADIIYVRPPSDVHLGVELDFEMLPGPIGFDITIPFGSVFSLSIPKNIGSDEREEEAQTVALIFLPVVQR